MKSKKKIEKILNESLNQLVKNKLCDAFKKYKDVIIVGDKAHIDSIGFVSLISSCEEKINENFKKKISINTNSLFKYCKNKKKIVYNDFLNFMHHCCFK